MTTNLIGQLSEFDSTKDSITTYVARVKLFIEANGIDKGRRVPVLLSLIGGKTYDLLRNLLSPTDPKEKTFDELIETLSTGATPVKGDVLKVTANQQTSCYCCGRSGHKPALCPVKGLSVTTVARWVT